MRVGILGSRGRMGQAIAAALTERGVACAGGADAGDDLGGLMQASDVLVDFSTPAALAAHLDAAVSAHRPIVVGTTGLVAEHHAAIDAAISNIAVLQAANTSLGVNLIAALVAQATARLGPEWDIEIVEMHHRHKVDAPSGTALLLAQAAASGRGKSLPELSRFDRFDSTDPREAGSIGFASLRGGSVAGDHMVVLAGEGERIELGHRAEGRDIFARGAVTAALWLAGKPAGRYTMNDVLRL